VPPMDAPYVRMAVVSDPQGAPFTVSKYMPPG
jgi:predicted enzyme related to lactoylglutathione lyase